MRTLPYNFTRTIPNRVAFRFLALTLLLVVAILTISPIASMIARLLFKGGTLDLSAFVAAAHEPSIGRILLNTVIVVSISSVIAIIIGSMLAWLSERTDARMGFFSEIIPVVPLLIPGVVLSIGWSFLLAPVAGFINIAIRSVLNGVGFDIAEGPFNIYSWPGLIWVYTLYFVPLVYLTMAGALRNLDSSYEEASRVCGAGRFTTFAKVILPAVRPAIGASFLLLIVFGIALFSVPAVIGLRARIDILPVRIVQLVTVFPPREDVALVLGSVMVVAVAGIWCLQRRLITQGQHATINVRSAQSQGIRLGRWRVVMRAAMLFYLILTTLLPFAALVVVSMQPFWSPRIVVSLLSLAHFYEILQQTYTRSAIVNSIVLSIAGATAAVLLATFMTYWREQQGGPLSQLGEAILKLPSAVSNILIGVGFVLAFAGWPLQLGGTITILLLAYIVIHLPQASFVAEGALSQVGRPLFEASFVSGAGPLRTLVSIALPLIRSGIVAGWVIVFVTMLGDLTVSAILAGTRTPVIGFVMLELWQGGTYPAVAALGVLVSLLSTIIVGAVLSLSRNR